MITTITFLPAAAALLILLGLPRSAVRAIRLAALFGSLATLIFSLSLLKSFEPGSKLLEVHEWVPTLGISYKVGVDGLSLFLVILTAFLTPVSILCAWKSVSRRVLEFHLCMLVLETGMIGVFVALDLVLFYVFWELTLIPMCLLIGVWGSDARVYAAVKFFIYTLAGSLLMFLAILYLYFHLSSHGAATFDVEKIAERLREFPLPAGPQMALFLAFALAFAIKVPFFPVHTWLPDAHTEAPTAGSVILAGVLLKMGAYGFLRFAVPFFPDAAHAAGPWLAGLAVVGIIYGACMCLLQEDMKRLVAYSSVSHMGFVMLGIFTFRESGITGGILQMVNHGLSTGALFLLVGVLYERRHTRKLAEYGGIAPVVPAFATVFLVTTLSSIGLPGLNGFVGEFLVLVGAFEWRRSFAVLAGLGVILEAAYMLPFARRLLFGKLGNEENRRMADLDGRELGILVPIVALMVLIGIASPWFTDRIAPAVSDWLRAATTR